MESAEKKELSEAGFTLAELVIVLGVIITIFVMSMGGLSYLWRWQKEAETKKNLADIQAALQTVYQSNAWSVDSQNLNTFVFSLNGIQYTLSNGFATDAGNTTALQAIASNSSLASSTIAADSMHNPLTVFVSNLLQDSNSGVSYHAVALVSSGWNGTWESTFDQTTGVLLLNGDDLGVIVSGWQYEVNNLQNTLQKMYIVRDSYQNYFTQLYFNDAQKDIYVDRFANQNSSCAQNQAWDSASGISNSACTGAQTTTATGLKSALGLSTDAVTTAWGRELLVDNSSAASRNPDTTGQAIPYTAVINAELPWSPGAFLTVTVTGLYQ
ncbi:MAG: hypothetical protein HQL09_09765 [Nitrospirae bacterium]|nr:hypothetical protein [Nitrospirota bacterium]